MIVVVSLPSARLVAKFGERKVVTLGLGLVALAYYILALVVRVSSPYIIVMFCMLLLGTGLGLLLPAVIRRIVSSLPPAEAGVGTAVNYTTLEVGAALGIATAGTLVSARYQPKVREVIDGIELQLTETLESPAAQVAIFNSGILRRRSPDVFREEAVQTLHDAEDSIDLARYAVRFFNYLGDLIGGQIADDVKRSTEQLYDVAIAALDSGRSFATFMAASIILLTGIAVFVFYPKNDEDEAVTVALNSATGEAAEVAKATAEAKPGALPDHNSEN